jgi:hypothetical protein
LCSRLPLLLALIGAPALAQDLSAGGHVGAHLRAATTGCEPADVTACGWLDFRDLAELGGWARADFGAAVSARIAVDARLHQGSGAALLDDTAEPAQVLETSLRIQDAWVDLRGFLVPPLDLKLGVQTFRWGVADGLHVADPVNPWDLEDPLSLDGRLPVPAASAILHTGQVQLQVAAVPVAWPAALPTDGLTLVPDSGDLLEGDAFADVDVGDLEARVSPPEATLGNSSVGGRLWWAAPFGDLALSAYHGRDSVPQAAGEMLLTGFATDVDRVDVAVPLIYPKIDLLGVEARGELFWQIGGWIEAAGVLPARTAVSASPSQLESLERLGTIDAAPDPPPELVTQDGQAYAKWVMGLDRSFGRFYLNAQWLRGFPTERQRADLGDYAAVALRVTLADPLVLTARGISDIAGWLVVVELAYLHGDAAALTIGGAWAEGGAESALSALSGASHVGVGAGVQF